MKLRLLIVYILVTGMPSLGASASPCSEVVLQEQRHQIDRQEFLGVLEETLNPPRPGSDGDLIRRVEALILKRLELLGVEYEKQQVGHRSIIVVLPSEQTSLNRLAIQSTEHYGSPILIEASAIARGEYLAAIDQIPANDERMYGFFLGLELLFDDERLSRNGTVLHEFRHLSLGLDQESGTPSPFHGFVSARRRFIPSTFPLRTAGYAKYLDFQELKTFHSGLRIELLKLRSLSRRGSDTAALAQIDSVASNLFSLIEVSSRSLKVSEIIKDSLETRPMAVNFPSEGEHVFAEFTWLKDGANTMAARIPLVQLPSNPTREQMLAAAKDQVDWLHETAVRALAQATWAQLELKPIVEGENAPPRSEIIEIINRVLPRLPILR